MNSVIVGLQYGDCGKGRVGAEIVKDYDWSIRYNGGPNAGHTVYDDDGVKHKFNHLPSGALFGKKVALDAGMVIDPNHLEKEINSVNGFELHISNNAHIITPEHRKKDSNGSGIGSTKRGIAYAYRDKVLRNGIKIGDRDLWYAHQRYDGLPPMLPGERALYEGGQGIMLDIDYGEYPYVTSSSVFPSIIHNITHRIGIMKPYITRVGDGPPYHDDIAELQIAGNEFGTTTGRTRKCTWLDLDELDYAIGIFNPDEIVLTKVDILKDIKNICVYKSNKMVTIGDLDTYIGYLLELYPQIITLSDAPYGPLKVAKSWISDSLIV